MTTELMQQVVSVAVQILVVVLLAVGSVVLAKAKTWLDKVKQKDTLGIINMITDRAVEYADSQLKGQAGEAKRAYAADYAAKILAEHGIIISSDQLLADIQNGYNKFKNAQAVTATVTDAAVTPDTTDPTNVVGQ